MYPYQLDRNDFTEVEEYNQGTTLFYEMYNRGYECHLLWSSNYIKIADKISKCNGKHTNRHESMKLNQSVGVNMPRDEERNNLKPDDDMVAEVMRYLVNELDKIDRSKPIFLWIHLPHVLLGHCGYGQVIDLLNRFVGELRTRFEDEGLYITADHGNMNGYKGKTTYGFDVKQPAICIPLIILRIDGKEYCDLLTTNAQLMEIILNEHSVPRKFIVSDTQYYAQPY